MVLNAADSTPLSAHHLSDKHQVDILVLLLQKFWVGPGSPLWVAKVTTGGWGYRSWSTRSPGRASVPSGTLCLFYLRPGAADAQTQSLPSQPGPP